MAHATDIRIGGTSYFSRLGELRSEMNARVANYRTYRNTLNELRALNMRELDDLGLAYADLRQVARTSVYGG